MPKKEKSIAPDFARQASILISGEGRSIRAPEQLQAQVENTLKLMYETGVTNGRKEAGNSPKNAVLHALEIVQSQINKEIDGYRKAIDV